MANIDYVRVENDQHFRRLWTDDVAGDKKYLIAYRSPLFEGEYPENHIRFYPAKIAPGEIVMPKVKAIPKWWVLP